MFSRFLLIAFGATLVSLSGVAGQDASSSLPSVVPAPGSSIKAQASENYTIVPLDGLIFRIIGEPETQTEVRVAADGTLNLPYIGSIKLAGKTVAEARQYLFDLYDKDWYVNPQIDLMVSNYSQRRVQVFGKVGRQGPVIFPPEEQMTLMGAIGYAGGWSGDNLARTTGVILIRTMPDGTVKEYEIDTTKIGPNDWKLMEGDIIKVPERRF